VNIVPVTSSAHYFGRAYYPKGDPGILGKPSVVNLPLLKNDHKLIFRSFVNIVDI
jgi:hypothetical protein